MSKERLEEIKHQLEESNSYDDNPNGYWYHNISWLIEQAEQTIELVVAYDNAQKEIQILKNRIELLKDQYGTVNKGLNDDVSKFRKQNKRYREALHELHKTRLFYHENLDSLRKSMYETINKALEGESNE